MLKCHIVGNVTSRFNIITIDALTFTWSLRGTSEPKDIIKTRLVHF